MLATLKKSFFRSFIEEKEKVNEKRKLVRQCERVYQRYAKSWVSTKKLNKLSIKPCRPIFP